MENRELPKVNVFISYCWTTPAHEEWALDLATRLVDNGVKVKFDKWDLKEGQDVYSFMESMVTDPNIDKVLIVCDKGYMQKAQERSGGVGTETQIITPQIYKDVNQEKFIPIVSERDLNNETFIPAYIKSRKYIDLSKEEVYEDGIEQLLRNLYGRPQYKKPALGTPPSYLFEDDVQHYKTSNCIKQLNDALNRNPQRIKGLSIKFIESFMESLEQFNIAEFNDMKLLDEEVVTKINEMMVIRDDYIKFLEIQCEAYEEINHELIINFFEDFYAFTTPRNVTRYNEMQFDHYRFLLHELFIYTTAILINNYKYDSLAKIIQSDFFVEHGIYGSSKKNFINFRFYLASLEEYRKKRLNSNKLSIMAEMMIQRTTIRKYPKSKFIEADLILYYLSYIYTKKNEHSGDIRWFPCTYVYWGKSKINLFQRLTSKDYFEKVKFLIGVNDPKELTEIISNFDNDDYKYSGSFDRIPNLRNIIDPNEVCKRP